MDYACRMVFWQFFGPGGSIRQLHQSFFENRRGAAFLLAHNKNSARSDAGLLNMVFKKPVENSLKNHTKIVQKMY